MSVYLQLLLIATLPTLAGRWWWCAGGEVVSAAAAAAGRPQFVSAPRRVVAARDDAAALHCRVLRLGDRTVSWIRSRDLQILSHAGAVFTADARVSVAVADVAPDALDAADVSADSSADSSADMVPAAESSGAPYTQHTLRIERLRLGDGGRYECQLNTEPKMSLFYNLTVLEEAMPRVVVEAGGGRAVSARAGAAVTLECRARYQPPPRDLPLPPLRPRWLRDSRAIDPQGARGGVSLESERWAGGARARLTLGALRPADAGRYTCAAQGASDSLLLHVLTDAPHTPEQLEWMQRDEAAAGRAPPPPPHFPLAATLLLLPIALQLFFNT